ncbi:class I SAM-dependent methyltransferase family protein [Methanobacterium movens]|nr:MAG: SAM-dependent methyltransferase [Methanobacterium sp.]
MLAFKVPKQSANDLRKFLLIKEWIDLDFKIKTDDKSVFIPLNRRLEDYILENLPLSKWGNIEIVNMEFESLKRSPKSIKEYLQGKLDDEKIEDLKKSFDIIGDVVILEIPAELEDDKYSIGEAALKFTRRKAVYRKSSEIKGVIRTRQLEHLAGEDDSLTIHQEYGSRLALDIKKVYFSPRLATERNRIASQVQEGEKILDMFAGVGPFSILIARKKTVNIYAVDINPDAVGFMKKNIQLNKLKGKIVPLEGDVREIVSVKKIKVDRTIMNLPGFAWEFLDTAVDSLVEGGVLHYYEFAADYKRAISRIKKAAYPRDVEILGLKKVKSSSPGEWQVVVDARIS